MSKFALSCPACTEDMSDCEILKTTVDNIKVVSTESVSESGKWIVTFAPDTTAGGIPIKSAFMKWWLKPVEYNTPLSEEQSKNNKFLKLDIESLEYEMKVYRDIIVPLLNRNICPNFVRFITGGEGCCLLDMSYLAKRDLENEAMNLRHIVDDGIVGVEKWDFNFFMTETMSGTTLTDVLTKETRPNVIEQIIFQVLAGCYAAAISRVTINDMHSGNIFIEEMPRTSMTYNYAGNSYTFSTSHRVRIYDFDRAYAKRLGPNKNLEEKFCEYGQCSEWIPNKDVYKLMCLVYKMIPAFRENVLKALSPNGKNMKKIERYIDDDQKCFNSDSRGTVDNKIFSMIANTTNIMKKWFKLTGMSRDVYATEIYTCNPEMFSDDGTLID
jgi:hypothetical protein